MMFSFYFDFVFGKGLVLALVICGLKVIQHCCSAPHALLAMGKVDPSHPDLAVDPLNILRPHSKLVHQLPLVIYSLECTT